MGHGGARLRVQLGSGTVAQLLHRDLKLDNCLCFRAVSPRSLQPNKRIAWPSTSARMQSAHASVCTWLRVCRHFGLGVPYLTNEPLLMFWC